MTFAQSAAEEFKKAPITVISTVLGQMIALLALLLAWLQYAGAATQTPAVSAQLHLGNLMLCVAFFLAMSLSLAVVIRFLARSHWFVALLMSVPAAVLAGFGTMVMLHLVPPRAFTTGGSELLTEVVFYGVAFIFVAINGLPVMRDLGKTDANEVQEFGRMGNAIGAHRLFLALGLDGNGQGRYRKAGAGVPFLSLLLIRQGLGVKVFEARAASGSAFLRQLCCPGTYQTMEVTARGIGIARCHLQILPGMAKRVRRTSSINFSDRELPPPARLAAGSPRDGTN